MTIEELLSGYFTEKEIAKAMGMQINSLRTYRTKDHRFPKPLKRGRNLLWEKSQFISYFKSNGTEKKSRRKEG